MKVILLQDVPKVGKKYEIKEVPNGLARNFLIPKKYVEPATNSSLKKIELMKANNVKIEEEKNKALHEVLSTFKDKSITIKMRATEKGGLFAKITNKEIIGAIKEKFNISILEDLIAPYEPFKKVGEYEIRLGSEYNSIPVQIIIEAE